MAYTFHTIIQHIREDAYTEKDKGGRFEKIIKNYFRTSRNYASQVKDIWLWGEFPYRSQFGGERYRDRPRHPHRHRGLLGRAV